MVRRFEAIKLAIEYSTFPLSPPILKSLSELTGAHWMTVDLSDSVASASLSATSIDAESIQRIEAGSAPTRITIDAAEYFAFRFERIRPPSRPEDVRSVIVLFETTQIDASARRAALLPLLTGLSTIVVVSGLMYFITSRWTGRLSRLESQVGRIALGDFDSGVCDDGDDEIGRLSEAINAMTSQLRSLWTNVNQQQSAKLLHQVSAGMAHQLRNTLTGARMAMELHQGSYEGDGPEEVRVAIRQLELAEDYVHRLLALGDNSI